MPRRLTVFLAVSLTAYNPLPVRLTSYLENPADRSARFRTEALAELPLFTPVRKPNPIPIEALHVSHSVPVPGPGMPLEERGLIEDLRQMPGNQRRMLPYSKNASDYSGLRSMPEREIIQTSWGANLESGVRYIAMLGVLRQVRGRFGDILDMSQSFIFGSAPLEAAQDRSDIDVELHFLETVPEEIRAQARELVEATLTSVGIPAHLFRDQGQYAEVKTSLTRGLAFLSDWLSFYPANDLLREYVTALWGTAVPPPADYGAHLLESVARRVQNHAVRYDLTDSDNLRKETLPTDLWDSRKRPIWFFKSLIIPRMQAKTVSAQGAVQKLKETLPPPPHNAETCRLDRGKLFVEEFVDEFAVRVDGIIRRYGIYVNIFPIYYGHLLMISPDERPQEMRPGDAAAGLEMARRLPGWRVWFNGWAAGASQNHFHMQMAPMQNGGDDYFPLRHAPAERLRTIGSVTVGRVAALPLRSAMREAPRYHLCFTSADTIQLTEVVEHYIAYLEKQKLPHDIAFWREGNQFYALVALIQDARPKREFENYWVGTIDVMGHAEFQSPADFAKADSAVFSRMLQEAILPWPLIEESVHAFYPSRHSSSGPENSRLLQAA